jgi:uncharacterized membrane protein
VLLPAGRAAPSAASTGLRCAGGGNLLAAVNPPAAREGQLSKHRLEGLSDGVFAVVLTLLVLELKVDHLSAHASDSEVWQQLAELRRPLVGYAVTFAIAGMFWLLQHRKFLLLTHTTMRHAWLTLLFLFWVTLLPFSISVWMRTISHPAGLFVYYANMALIGGSLLAGWLDARWSGLVLADRGPEVTRLTSRIGAMTAGFAVAAAVSWFSADLAVVALMIVIVASRLVTRKFVPAAP